MLSAPREAEKRFPYRMTIFCEGDSVPVRIEVNAVDSVTPGLALTAAIINGKPAAKSANRWHVTHTRTRRVIDGAKYGMPLERARLVAGALGGLPIDWTASSYQEIQRQWATYMPLDLKNWVKQLS